jgi:signal transduction histidine kinase
MEMIEMDTEHHISVKRLRRRIANRIERAVMCDLLEILNELRSRNIGQSELSPTRMAMFAAEKGVSLSRRLMRELRSCEGGLEPAPPVDLGTALEAVLAEKLAQSSIPLLLHCDSVVLLPPRTAEELLAIVREVAINVAKHAVAKTARCMLSVTSGSVLLRIDDDGIGFDKHSPKVGFGLIGVAERAQSIGAVIHIDTFPGEGVMVTVRLPIPTFIDIDPPAAIGFAGRPYAD